MIVLAIISAVMLVAAPRLSKKNTNVKTIAREFLVLSKEVRNKARLSNSTYRIVINMEPDNESYWVERASGPRPVDPDAAEKEKDSKEDQPPSAFQIDKSITKKQKKLPSGLRFASVESINMKAPVTSGAAYIHFFPEGFVEASALQITDGNNLTWTLVFNPLTGQADIVEKAATLKDIER
ncbi:hypothetical protein BDW_05440 [Bdellovibrio bacteriovorus W]|nr:hypothetical protein BDW_05440 [Bdellovibrio bacteriovorus W]